ncbi:MAG: Iron-sulfur clusters transporter atm1, mitochondrial [Marteilia pararefringens]
MLLWRPLRSHYKFHELRSDLLRRSRVIAWRSAASPVRYSILSQHLSRRSMNAINSCNFSTTSTPSETDLQNLSTNVSPKHTEKNKESLIAIYRRIWRDYIFKSGEYLNNCQFLAIASCFIASKTIDAQSGFILKDIVNRISGIHTDPAIYSNIKSLIFLYGAIRIGASLLYNVGNFLTSLKSLKAYEGVTKQSFLSVLLSPFLFHTSKKTGTIIRSIERGTSGINSLVQLSIASILPTIYQISLVMGMVFFELGSIHALTILATTVLYSLFTCIMTHFRLKIRRKVIHHDNSASAYLTDTLINFEAVKIFQNSHFESQSHIKHIKNVVKWSKLQSLTLSALNAGQTAIFASGFTFCQYLTLNHILSGTLTVGDLVLINTLMWQLYSPLFYMGMLYRETSRSLVDISNLFSTLDDSKSKNISISIDYENNGPSTDRQTEAIKVSKEEFRQQPILLKDISLSYPEKKDVLKNFNFEITPKSKIGIVGLSGSG